MTKETIVKAIAEHRAQTTPHKDIERHIRNLNKMSKRQLEMVAKRENLI